MDHALKGILAAALVALVPAAAQAVPLVNPGFETGDLTGWDTSGDVTVVACAGAPDGCAPGGGLFLAALNETAPAAGNASLTQNVAGVGAGSYTFGAWVSFGTNDPAGNFDQGQVSLSVQGQGVSETAGFDPNALSGQFTNPGSLGFMFTDWFLLTGTLDYAGSPGDFLININVQDFTADKGLTLLVDNAFIALVPIPASLLLLGSALAGLGAVRRFGRA